MKNKEIAPNPIKGSPSIIEDAKDLTPEDRDKRRIHLADIVLKYGDGEDYNRDRIEGEIITYAKQYRELVFETGKRLILLKEHEGHGNYLKSLDRLKIDERTARNMMSVARMFLDEHGNPKRGAISDLPSTKLYALASLDDETLDELEEGKIDGLTPEEATKLSTREFKRRISDLKNKTKELEDRYKQDMEVKDQLLMDKNKKIDDLDGQIRLMTDPARWQEQAEEALIKLHKMAPRHTAIIGEFAKIVEWVTYMDVKDWERSQAVLLQHAKYTLSSFNDDLDRLDDMLNRVSPRENPVFHEMTSLPTLKLTDGPEE